MLTQKIQAYIARGGNPDRDIPVMIEFGYDDIFDPLAVSALFTSEKDGVVEEDKQVWTFARDLALRGSLSLDCFGKGDIKFQYLGDENGGLIMCLKNSTGHADVWIPQREFVTFLEDTTALLMVGQEDLTKSLDEELKEILG